MLLIIIALCILIASLLVMLLIKQRASKAHLREIEYLNQRNAQLQKSLSELKVKYDKLEKDRRNHIVLPSFRSKMYCEYKNNPSKPSWFSFKKSSRNSNDLGGMTPLHRSSSDDFSGGWGGDSWSGQDFY